MGESDFDKGLQAIRRAFMKAGLLCLFRVFAGAAIEFALDQAFKKFGHGDVIILRHFQHKDLGFRGDSKLNFLGFFPNKFWHSLTYLIRRSTTSTVRKVCHDGFRLAMKIYIK